MYLHRWGLRGTPWWYELAGMTLVLAICVYGWWKLRH